MKWDEFKSLIAGIDSKTPLGRIVTIRAEEDKNVLKNFSKEQHKIRNEWRSRNAKKVSQEDLNACLDSLKKAFLSMAGDSNKN